MIYRSIHFFLKSNTNSGGMDTNIQPSRPHKAQSDTHWETLQGKLDDLALSLSSFKGVPMV